MMTLKDAIKHAEECAKSCDMLADISVVDEVKERNHRCAEEHRQLADWLKELQRYQWIPCSERLPDYGEKVLVHSTDYSGKSTISIGERNDDGMWDCEPFWFLMSEEFIVAWMPLPEPYEPMEEDDE